MAERIPGDPEQNEALVKLEELSKEYETISSEAFSETGMGPTSRTTGYAERIAIQGLRQALKEFLLTYPETDELPETIYFKDRLSNYHRAYFLPRTNEIYVLDHEEIDPRFDPDKPDFCGIDVVRHLIKQNKGKIGFAIYPSGPRFSREQAETWGRGERYRKDYEEVPKEEEFVAIIAGLEKSLRSERGKLLFGGFQRRIAEIRRIQQEQQEIVERKYETSLKEELGKLMSCISKYLHIVFPEVIPLQSKEDDALEEGMVEFTKAMGRRFGETGKFEKKVEGKRMFHYYFRPHELRMIVVPRVKKRKLLKVVWEEDWKNVRDASSHEFLEQRWKINSAIRQFLPEDVRYKFPGW